MNNHNLNLYRWLEQHGEAFGAPGMEPRWTSSVKDAVGTAYSASSRVWFTCSHGILNEIYHPTIDHPQVRDMEFLITDGETFMHEEKRDLDLDLREHARGGAGRAVHQPGSRWPLHADQGDHLRSAPLACCWCTGGWRRHEDLLARLKVYALLAPHLDGGGAGNTAGRWTLPDTRCWWPGRTSGRWPWAPVAGFRE